MAEPRGPLRLALMWTLQSQFAGYVRARERDLPELEFVPRNPGRGPIQELLDGRAEIGTISPSHLLAAGATARELVFVGLFMPRSTVRLVGLRERAGERLEPGARLRVAVWKGEYTEIRAVLRSAGVDLADVEFVAEQDEAGALLDGRVDFVQATTYNELPALERLAGGAEALVVHSPVDHGVDVAKDGVVVRRELLERDPELVERFLRASIAGWRDVLADPDGAVEAVRALRPELDPEHERAQLRLLLELFEPGHPLGEPRASELARAERCARAAGEDVDGAAVQLDRGPWERVRG